jgi:hypothetical protein
LGFVRTKSREKHSPEPVEFGMPGALFTSFGYRTSLVDCLKRFRGTIRKM